MKHLRISPGGRLANQMIQFMIAKKLQQLVPGLVIHGYDLPLWCLSAPSPERLRIAGPELTGNLFDVRHVAGLMNAGWIDGAHLTGFSLNMSNFGSRDECSELFQPPSESPPGFGKDELAIHVRGEDILTGGASGLWAVARPILCPHRRTNGPAPRLPRPNSRGPLSG